MLDLKADPIGYVTNNPALWTDEEADKMFVVTANGNGMINAGIHDRDMLFFCISDKYNNGDIVAVNVNGESVVRRLFKEADGVRLRREIGCGEDTYATEYDILGRLVGIQRKM